jgi:hypothetical protein
MILYHGSNVKIETIDLAFSRKGKDFGKGFYLNPDMGQAMDMAERTARILSCGAPTINSYFFDENLLSDDEELNVKIFDDYSAEWADFVIKNRRNESEEPVHHYDIVIGPIADDTVGVQIHRYLLGYIGVDVLVDELRFGGSRSVQYYFGTEKAIGCLKRIDL